MEDGYDVVHVLFQTMDFFPYPSICSCFRSPHLRCFSCSDLKASFNSFHHIEQTTNTQYSIYEIVTEVCLKCHLRRLDI